MLYSKDSRALVYDLIAAANPQIQPPLSNDNCTIEAITAVTPNAANGMHNTSARIRGQQGDGYMGSFVVFYNRIDLSKVILPSDTLNGLNNYVQLQNYAGRNIHQMLPQICLQVGLNLNTWDIQNNGFSYPSQADRIENSNITAVPTSPAYIGAVNLRVYRGKPDLGIQITATALTVLNHADKKVDDLNSAGLLTWGIDFSDYKNYFGSWANYSNNWDSLRQILTDRGVPDYPRAANSNYISDATTASVAGANRDYDRVFVQTGIVADNIVGVAYYHYNNR
ncbi:hypothetical protein pEaSNUABM54_00110 [Erwinia phage pEa_SNUABM_54]|nr:hypothetical protein pEaSNUABM54_00110 [Erwinia phage pEa_SNUABM_54]